MKKELNLMICFFILIFAFALFLILFAELRTSWFSVALFFLSIYLIIKSYFFRSDSSFFGAILAILCSIIFCKNLQLWSSLFQLGALFNMAVSVAFFVDFLFFYSNFTFYSFLTNFLLSFPVFLYSFNCINLLLMILLLSGAVLLIIATILAKKYGKI